MTEQRIPRALSVLVGVAAAIVVLAGVRETSSIVGPVVLALVLVIAVSPVREWLTRRRAPTWVIVAVPLALVIVFLLGMVAVLTVSVAQLAALIPTYSDQLDRLVADAQALATRLGYGNAEINRALESLDPGQLLQLAQQFLSGLLGVLSSLFLIVVLLLAMSLDAPVFARALAGLGGNRPRLIEALTNFTYRVRRYLIVSTIFGIICAVLDIGALYLLGVPLPLLWGVLALITNYIPNIGFIIGLVPPALLGLLEGGPRTMILAIVAYMAINVVIQSFIQPKFLGDAVGLSTTVTFLSLILWTFVLGPLGALLAIPLSLFTRALLVDSDPAALWAGALISGESPAEVAGPPVTPEARADRSEATPSPSADRGASGTSSPLEAERHPEAKRPD
ncbi:AI-2E family transporter [Thermopolyspora sp. NPDC052614]|uniref:AI-2E family transporter n=1 Tax=Thermopolyspora sp. NPDC052614 TaxID=3155682 RepID=UPI003442B9D7